MKKYYIAILMTITICCGCKITEQNADRQIEISEIKWSKEKENFVYKLHNKTNRPIYYHARGSNEKPAIILYLLENSQWIRLAVTHDSRGGWIFSLPAETSINCTFTAHDWINYRKLKGGEKMKLTIRYYREKFKRIYGPGAKPQSYEVSKEFINHKD